MLLIRGEGELGLDKPLSGQNFVRVTACHLSRNPVSNFPLNSPSIKWVMRKFEGKKKTDSIPWSIILVWWKIIETKLKFKFTWAKLRIYWITKSKDGLNRKKKRYKDMRRADSWSSVEAEIRDTNVTKTYFPIFDSPSPTKT